jgi:hypothetical protein
VHANSTKALQDINNLSNNASLLTEVTQRYIESTKSDANQVNATQNSSLLPGQQIKSSDGTTGSAANLTAIKQVTAQ